MKPAGWAIPLVSAGGIALGAAFFAVSLPQDGVFSSFSEVERPVLALVAFLVPLFISERIAVWLERADLRAEGAASTDRYLAEVQNVREMLKSTVDIVTFPSPAAAMEYVIANVPRARNVVDTRVFFSVAEDDADVARHRKDRASRYDDSRSRALSAGAIWRDLYSENRKADLSEHYAWMASQDGDFAYAARVFPAGQPIINFIIIDYDGNTSDLLFGWGYHKLDKQGAVFLTRDPAMVVFFRKYYDLLWDLGRPFQVRGEGPAS